MIGFHLQAIPEWWAEFVDRCRGRLATVLRETPAMRGSHGNIPL